MGQRPPSTSATHDGRLWALDPTTNTYVPITLTTDGKLPVNASVSVSGADGSILDGADATIKATVKNYTNSKPLAVVSVDTNGDPTGGSAVSIANGADVTEGALADAAVGDASGSVNAHARYLAKVLADIWTSASHFISVSVANATLAVTQSGSWVLAAGTALIGLVVSSIDTSTIYNGSTALTPKFAIISASNNGNNALVAAVAAKKIRVLAYNLIASGSVNAKFQSDGAGAPADKTGLKYCVANSGLCAPFNPVGWFESGSGKSLDLNLSAGVAVGGELVYVEV